MDYSYYDYATTGSDSALALLAGLGIGAWIISMVVCIIMIVSMWKIFKKAGKNGWEAIIPIYNIIVLLEICKIDLWQIVLFIIPIANIYIMFKIYIELAKKFGKSTGFGVFTVFFPIIGLPILAFGDAEYEDSENDSSYSNSSILDVKESGVPNNSEAKDFSYGYEKEETVVMDPVKDDKDTEKDTTTENTKDKEN